MKRTTAAGKIAPVAGLGLTAFALLFLLNALPCSGKTPPENPTAKGPKVKNVVIMICDGCGYNQAEAAGYYQYGSSGVPVYDKFPVRLGMSTYSYGKAYDPALAWKDFDYVADDYTDSAAAATAMACGVKTYDSAIGVDVDGKPLQNVLEAAEELGKATGVVTSVEFSHATPAGFVAHNAYRDDYAEIAKEMIYRSPLEVIMGCGHPLYSNDGRSLFKPGRDYEGATLSYDYRYVGGYNAWTDLSDGRATGADSDNDGTPDEWTVIETRADFQSLAAVSAPPRRVIGVARVYTTLQQARGGNSQAAPFVVPFNPGVPTLEEMSRAALNVLGQDADGFVLMIEGGAVDWAGHNHQSGRMIEEKLDFDKAIEAVIGWVEKNSGWHETLLIVTGDHETGYLTGPGSGQTESGPVWNPLVNNGAGSVPGMEWHSRSHTNSLIPLYAKGQGAALLHYYADRTDPFRGRYIDNTEIAKLVFRLLR